LKPTANAALKSETALYLLIALLLTLVGTMSFHRNGYITGGDISPGIFFPNNSAFPDSLKLWGNSISGLGSPQYNPAFVVLGTLNAVVSHLGFTGPTAEFFVLILLFVAEGLGVAYFTRQLFADYKLAAIVAGIALPLSLFNALVFTNPIQAFAVGFFPFSAGLLFRRLREPITPAIFAVELGLLSFGLMILSATPPLAVFYLMWVALWLALSFARYRNLRTALPGLAGGSALAVLVHAWWCYAAVVTLFGGGETTSQSFSSALDWRWVDARATLLNLVSMQAFWAWPRAEYYPWARPYLHGFLHASLYFPAFFALIGLLLSPYRKRTAALTAITLTCLFLAKGTQPPLGWLNAFLYSHMPGFWLFRDPQVEANIPLYLCVFTLAAVGIDEVSRHLFVVLHRGRLRKFQHWNLAFLDFLMVAAMCASGWAIVSGSFIPSKWLLGKASMVIRLPSYWYGATAFLNKQTGDSRVLILPNDDYYQMPYTWGYYGADALAQALLHRPVVSLAPISSGYLSANTNLLNFQARLLADIRTKPNMPIASALRPLGIGWILQRDDVAWDDPKRDILSAPYLKYYLAHQKHIARVASFGKLSIYKLEDPSPAITSYDGLANWDSMKSADLPSANALFGESPPWFVGPLPSSFRSLVKAAGSEALGRPDGTQRLETRRPGRVSLQPKSVVVDLQKVSDHALLLRLVGPSVRSRAGLQTWQLFRRITLSGLVNQELVFNLGNKTFLIPSGSVTRTRYYRAGTFTPQDAGNPVPINVWSNYGSNVLKNAHWGVLSDCERMNSETPLATGFRSSVTTQQMITLKASDHAACVALGTTLKVAPADAVLIRTQYRHRTGAAPVIALSLDNRVVVHVPLSSEHRWQTWSRWVRPERHRHLAIFVYSYGSAGRTTSVNTYSRPVMWQMHELASDRVVIASRILRVSPGLLTLTDSGPEGGTTVLHDPNFRHGLWSAPFNASASSASPEQRGLSARIEKSGLLDLRARNDGVGEAQTLNGVNGSRLRIAVEARCLEGSAPKMRLYSPSNNATIWESSFSNRLRVWQSTVADVYVANNDQDTELVFYAYGNEAPSHVQFRNISVSRWPSRMGDVVWVGGTPPRSLPVTAQRNGNGLSITLRPQAKTLVLNTSFASGWTLAARGRALSWKHFPVYGFLNGWIVPRGVERHDISVYYAPDRLYGRLQRLALLLTLLLPLSLLYMRRRFHTLS